MPYLASQISCNDGVNEDFMPAYRRQALIQLRTAEPKTCRDLIATCFMKEAAEERIKILDVFYINLSADDVQFLQTLHKDRSQKVAITANNLLIRAGYFYRELDGDKSISEGNDIDVDENIQIDLTWLADSFKITNSKNGKRTQAILYREHKKRNKRRQLLTQYGLFALEDCLTVNVGTITDKLRTVNEWILSLNEEDFMTCLPLFMRTFAKLATTERQRLLYKLLSRQKQESVSYGTSEELNGIWEEHVKVLKNLV